MSAGTAVVDLLAPARLAEKDLDRLEFRGPEAVLPTSFAVTDAAGALVGAVGLAIDRIAQLRAGTSAARVSVDLVHAAVAFQSERHLRFGDRPPRLWDPLAGYYRARDGWVQFHTNFDHHRLALLDSLGLGAGADRPAIEAAVTDRSRFEIEDIVSGQGGIAAAVRTVEEWERHPHAIASDSLGLLTVESHVGSTQPLGPAPSDRPLAGLRVLDLTRIIAGPVCGRTLAAYGADVLRVGADHLPIVEPILADTTLGKRFCHVNLDEPTARDVLRRLAAGADVVITGFRPGALAGRGLGADDFFDANPGLVIAELSAFGSTGPWGERRGFDSITQSATGIVSEETASARTDRPTPLPCQLLDHGSGYLLTLGILAGLAARHEVGGRHRVAVSLLGTRNWLIDLGRHDHFDVSPLSDATIDTYCDRRESPWGRIRHVRHPDPIVGIEPRWQTGPTRPGADEPVWLPRP